MLQAALSWESRLENQKSLAKLVKTKTTDISGQKTGRTDLEENPSRVKVEPIGAMQRPITGHSEDKTTSPKLQKLLKWPHAGTYGEMSSEGTDMS